MISALAISVFLFFLSSGLIAGTCILTIRLTPQGKQKQMLRWLGAWGSRGVLLPALVWALMNIGFSWRFPPFMPDVQAAQAGGQPWAPEWLRVTATGLFILASYWASATLLWVLFNTVHAFDHEPRKDFKALCLTCSLGLGIPALILLLLGGWPVLGIAAAMVAIPVASYAPSLLQPNRLPPMYARAIARMKFGKYSDAEWEIIRELEKREDDFEGWMMLAELYAVHFHDMSEAERTILEICDQPKLTPSQLAICLHRLADWHLKESRDPEAARRALHMLADRLKGTHLARMALLRVAQLPASREELADQQTARPIPLPALGDRLDHENAPEPPPLDRKHAARAANACVDTLKKDPNNVAAREKLARVFAEHLDRADLGIEQVLLLLNMPDQPDSKRAEWLSLVAAWYLKHQQDVESGRRFLERLVQEFPASPHAFSARRRLEQLKSYAHIPKAPLP
jgi:hypothetical protein